MKMSKTQGMEIVRKSDACWTVAAILRKNNTIMPPSNGLVILVKGQARPE